MSVLGMLGAVSGLISVFGLAIFVTARHEHRSPRLPLMGVRPPHVRAFRKDQPGAICQ